jgi:DNA-binding transcriptional MerR regulator
MGESGPNQDLIGIGSFARRSGMTRRQLRYYHQLGLLVPAVVDPATGYRYYRSDQAERAEAIALLRSVEVPLAEIQDLLSRDDDRRLDELIGRQRRRAQQRLTEARELLQSLDRVEPRGSGMEARQDQAVVRCSFCGRKAGGEVVIVAGRGGAGICDVCIESARAAADSAKTEGRQRVRGALYPWEHFSGPAHEVLRLGQEEAEHRGHAYIGTEHLLLALLHEQQGAGGAAARALGITYEQLSTQFEQAIPPGEHEGVVLPTNRVKEVIGLAFDSAEGEGREQVTSADLFQAILTEGHGLAATALLDAGVDPSRVKSALAKLSVQEDGTTDV